jgi:hypothetical protein
MVTHISDLLSWWSFWELIAAASVATIILLDLPFPPRENKWAVLSVVLIITLAMLFIFKTRGCLLWGSLLICGISLLFVLFDVFIYRREVQKGNPHKLGGYTLCYIDLPILSANVLLFLYFLVLTQATGSKGLEVHVPLIAFRDGAVAFEMLAGNLGIIFLRFHPEITSRYMGPCKLLGLIDAEFRGGSQQQ